MSSVVILSIALVVVCALTSLGTERVASHRLSLALAGVAFVLAGVTLAHLASSVVGVASPDPASALAFLLLAACGGGWIFFELDRIARAHSATAAFAILAANCGASAATFVLS
jgi:hypothetical protein